MKPADLPPPVAIGALGGSGTRVFATLLRELGVHIGEDLNPPLDNLWFSVLFKRRPFVRRGATEAELDQSVRLLRDAMTTGLAGRLLPGDAEMLAAERADLLPLGKWQTGAESRSVDTLLASRGSDGRPWGWKEPNTHVFLPALDARLPGLRYIHIVRDAYDMVMASRLWQVRKWAPPDRDTPMSLRQLRWWVQANGRAIDHGARMGDRFLLISYEDFCARPQAHWDRLMAFLDPLGLEGSLPRDLVEPTTIGRGAALEPSAFPEEDHAAVAALEARISRLGRA